MHKKLIAASMAITAFAAFFVAPAASASPVLTDDVTGTKVPVGAKIVATNTNNIEFTGGFNLACTHALLTGEVTANTGTRIAGVVPAASAIITGTAADGDCTSALGNIKWNVNSALCFETVVATDNVKITGCAGAQVTFSLNVTGVIACKYSEASVTAQYKTNTTATLSVENQPAKEEEPKSFFCPDEGKLKMDFDLYTDNNGLAGEPLKVS